MHPNSGALSNSNSTNSNVQHLPRVPYLRVHTSAHAGTVPPTLCGARTPRISAGRTQGLPTCW